MSLTSFGWLEWRNSCRPVGFGSEFKLMFMNQACLFRHNIHLASPVESLEKVTRDRFESKSPAVGAKDCVCSSSSDISVDQCA